MELLSNDMFYEIFLNADSMTLYNCMRTCQRFEVIIRTRVWEGRNKKYGWEIATSNDLNKIVDIAYPADLIPKEGHTCNIVTHIYNLSQTRAIPRLCDLIVAIEISEYLLPVTIMSNDRKLCTLTKTMTRFIDPLVPVGAPITNILFSKKLDNVKIFGLLAFGGFDHLYNKKDIGSKEIGCILKLTNNSYYYYQHGDVVPL